MYLCGVVTERDKVTENVREHLERIVESHVDEGIDAVSLARIFDHPQCKCPLFLLTAVN